MKKLSISIIVAAVTLVVLTGTLLLFHDYDKESEKSIFLVESFKTTLSFFLITSVGLLLKNAIDSSIQRDTERKLEYHRIENLRKDMIEHFTTIYSEFYSIRKFYHSVRSLKNNIAEETSESKNDIFLRLVEKSSEKEGEYGSLKVKIIHEYSLPSGNFEMKPIEELISIINSNPEEKMKIRCQLDLLGEFYDDWRHAMESPMKRKIFEANDVNRYHGFFYSTYSELLNFLETGAIKSRA